MAPTVCSLDSPARSHELQHCTYPSPSTNMSKEWQKRRREMEEEVSRKWEVTVFFFAFNPHTSQWPGGFLQKRKQERKLAVEGKSGSLWGENVQQQLRPGLSPASAQPPLRTVLHTHVPIYSQWAQSLPYVRAPLLSNAWSQAWK